jgi:hypothetical protein
MTGSSPNVPTHRCEWNQGDGDIVATTSSGVRSVGALSCGEMLI